MAVVVAAVVVVHPPWQMVVVVVTDNQQRWSMERLKVEVRDILSSNVATLDSQWDK